MSAADTTRGKAGFWDRLRELAGRVGRGTGGGAKPRGTMPSYEVTDLLARARVAGPRVSALDAVMGEDWAIVEAGRAGRAPVVRAGIAAAHRRDVARHGGGGGGGGRPGGKPQAVVKMIRQGGASDLRGLRAQMAYLSRQGEEPLQRSERYMGVEIDAEQAGLLEQAWRMPAEGREGAADRTTHFIVSFPEGTPVGAAERAGRDWAEAMFGSGEHGGDSFDYYTAFHTDRAHPHMHVVVHRRGLEHGEWLKVSLRSDIHYDRMREVLVDVAARQGIALEATPRLARGLHDRPAPDAEYRRAGVERREPVAPEHSPETALRAAAGLVHHARGLEMEARAVELTDPAQAERLRAAGLHLGEGRALTPAVWGLPEPPERTGAPARRTAARAEILENVARMDRNLPGIGDPVERVRFMREVAALKAETAPTLGAQGQGLEAYTRPDESGRYDGLAGHDVSRVVARPAELRVAAIAERYGVDKAATRARFAGGVPSAGLAADFALSERLERRAAVAALGRPAETEAAERRALDQMHREIGEVHAVARAGHVPLRGVTLADIRAREAREAETERQARAEEARRAAERAAARRGRRGPGAGRSRAPGPRGSRANPAAGGRSHLASGAGRTGRRARGGRAPRGGAASAGPRGRGTVPSRARRRRAGALRPPRRARSRQIRNGRAQAASVAPGAQSTRAGSSVWPSSIHTTSVASSCAATQARRMASVAAKLGASGVSPGVSSAATKRSRRPSAGMRMKSSDRGRVLCSIGPP